MNADLIARRRDLVKDRAFGVSLHDAVERLSLKYQVTRSAIYKDWKRRRTWLSAIVGIDDPTAFFLELVAAHLEVKRLAMKEYLTGDNSAARIGALRLIRELNLDLNQMLVTHDLIARVERLETQTR